MSDAAPPKRSPGGPSDGRVGRIESTIEDLYADLTDLTDDHADTETREEVRDITHLLAEAHERGLIESSMRDLRLRDAAEAFVGSVIFASPLLVEDGIFDIAEYLFGFTAYGVPVFLIANTGFVVFMTYALLEWTGRNTEETRTILGVVPVRVVMILAVSFVVATVLMVVWGRVDGLASPVEAIARINVIWTVGSLGAALGDIIAGDDAAPSAAANGHVPNGPQGADGHAGGPPRRASVRHLSDGALVQALHEQFDDLESVVDGPANRSEVTRLREETMRAAIDDALGDQIEKYTSRDIAEAFVGSIFFSIPFLVEDGVFDVAEFFVSFRVGPLPVYLLANTLFVLTMILALIYWAGPRDVRMSRPIFGIVPRRLVGTAVVSFLTAAALMTMWGRVGNWADPAAALARISVVWTVASFGAALGDILPGESSGADINDDLAALGALSRDDDADP